MSESAPPSNPTNRPRVSMSSTASTAAASNVFLPEEKAVSERSFPADLPSEKQDHKVAETDGEEVTSNDSKDEPEPEYPSGPTMALLTLGLCLAVFLVALVSDITSCTRLSLA
jgi:hypothetical protein